jgi:hypothetical protein
VDGLRSAPKKVLLPTELKKRNSVGPPHDAVPEKIGPTTSMGKRGERTRR